VHAEQIQEPADNPLEEPQLAIPEEPIIEGGILSENAETQLEPRSAVENTNSFPFNDLPPDGDCIPY